MIHSKIGTAAALTALLAAAHPARAQADLQGVWAIAKRMFDVQQPLLYLMCTALAILAGLIFGLLCHHYIERPLLAVRTRRGRAVPAT